MRIFMSGEIDKDVFKDFTRIQKEIELDIKKLESGNYGNADLNIGIIPIIVQDSLLKEGFFKERRLYRKKSHDADLRLQIDFD